MSYTHLITRRAGRVEYLTLNRPRVRNAFNDEMIAELGAWAHDVATDSHIRAVVLAGAGATFCAGADVEWMAKTVSYTEAENLRDAAAAARTFSLLNTLPVPLVGRV